MIRFYFLSEEVTCIVGNKKNSRYIPTIIDQIENQILIKFCMDGSDFDEIKFQKNEDRVNTLKYNVWSRIINYTCGVVEHDKIHLIIKEGKQELSNYNTI